MSEFTPIWDHPRDVLAFLAEAGERSQATALVTVTNTLGGGVRAVGALMGVNEEGQCAGYISNGCVDGDVVANALEVIAQSKPRQLRYGEGSPFLDIRLPCGGAIELLITPNPAGSALASTLKRLDQREPSRLQILPHGVVRTLPVSTAPSGWKGGSFEIKCDPKLRARVAGSGAEALAFSRLALACGFELELLSPDRSCLEEAAAAGVHKTTHLTKPEALRPEDDDRWTAFIMMFHDHDWDSELLHRALQGPAFYIGALGSRKTHAKRCDVLKDRGVSPEDIARIHGPIGLVPALRDASTLAVSALAEVISVYEASQRQENPYQQGRAA